MGWEQRGSRRYFYEKVRIGSRVRSLYHGRGEIAEIIAENLGIRRQGRERARDAYIALRESEMQIDRSLDAQGREVMSAVGFALQAAGYRKHKGQWRKRRHEKKQEGINQKA